MSWYLNRSGERLSYEEKGAGCPVVLLHGWCMSAAVWKYQFEALSETLRVIIPDLRGHGLSSGVSVGLTFENFADDLADLFNTLQLSNVLLVGWSMGAQVSMAAYSQLADKIAGLILVSATPCFTATADFTHALPDKESRGMRIKIKRNTNDALKGFYSQLFAEGELEDNATAVDIKNILSLIISPNTDVALEALDSLATADMRNLLSSIVVPTLIINGSADRICVPEASNYLKEHILKSEKITFPSTAHAPFLSHSQKFNEAVLKFSRSVCEQHF